MDIAFVFDCHSNLLMSTKSKEHAYSLKRALVAKKFSFNCTLSGNFSYYLYYRKRLRSCYCMAA